MANNDFEIQSAAHTGFTVASLPAALEFWHGLLGLSVLYQRSGLNFGIENNIVGVPGAGANVALLALPNGHQVELLEYTSPAARTVYEPRPCDVGNVHLALNVTNSRALVQRAKRLGWVPASEEPVELRRGDGTLWAIIYLRGPDGVTVELMEQLEGL